MAFTFINLCILIYATNSQYFDCDTGTNCNHQWVIDESSTTDTTFYCPLPSNCNSNMIIYFGGKSVLISCQGFGSCDGLTVFCGTFDTSNPNVNQSRMDDNNVTCTISCELSGSCNNINMYCNGNNVHNCNIQQPTVTNGMSGSTLECSNIHQNSNCTLDCSAACDSTNNLICHSESSCSCNGQCSNINQVIITVDPTTNIPTNNPITTAPTTLYPTTNVPTNNPITASPTLVTTDINTYINLSIAIETNMSVNNTKIMFEHVLSIALSDIEYKLEVDIIQKDNDVSIVKLIIYSSEIHQISKDQLLRDINNNLIAIYNVYVVNGVQISTTLLSIVSTFMGDNKSKNVSDYNLILIIIIVVFIVIVAVLIFIVYYFKCKKKEKMIIDEVKSLENKIETDSKFDIEMMKTTNGEVQNIETHDLSDSSGNAEDLFTTEHNTRGESDDDINDMYQSQTHDNITTKGDAVTNGSNVTTQGHV
eukprot:535184_1